MIIIADQYSDVSPLLSHVDREGVTALQLHVFTMQKVFDQKETLSECYVDMNPDGLKRTLEIIEADACKRWNLAEVAIMHRVGTLVPDELLYAVAVSTRDENVDVVNAIHYILKRIKGDINLWRKELYESGRIKEGAV